MQAAVALWMITGGEVAMVTLTMRHHRGEPLEGLWRTMSKAWGRVTSGKQWTAERGHYGLAGYARAVEVTWGRNGWHPHLHVLLFLAADTTASDVAALHSGMFARWQRALSRSGRVALAAAQDAHLVTGPADEALAEYLTKSTDRAGMVGLELAWSQGKATRQSLGTATPWRLLDYVQVDGDAESLDMWHEYEKASKGKRQLTWSQGLRDLLRLGQEKTDDEIAGEELGSNDDDLVRIDAQGWRRLVAVPVHLAQLLAATEVGGLTGCRSWLDQHGVSYEVVA